VTEGSAARILGVDVGGTKVAVAELEGAAAMGTVEHPTDISSSDALLDGVESAVREVIGTGPPPAAVGVGVPSQVDWKSGAVVASVNIPLEGVPLREELGRRLAAPVFVDNDANCAALAEAQLVDNPPALHLVMLTLGTGVGGGVVIGGRIFRGATGLGAELGHVVIDEDGPECPGNCPSRGCLEAMCSGTALERDATALAAERPDSELGRLADGAGRVKGRAVVEAARAGDGDALRLLERLGHRLGVGIAGFANAFEPEHVVIGGGLSAAGDLFLEAARREASERALPAIWSRVRLSLARGGPAAGVIGAGLLALQEDARNEDTEHPH
jgi:glucokinase